MTLNDNKNRSRKNRLTVCLDDTEKMILEKKFQGSGLSSISQFIRYQIVYGDVFVTDFRELKETRTEINRIGNNINQIAKRMNETGTAFIQDVKEVKKLMKKIDDLLLKALKESS